MVETIVLAAIAGAALAGLWDLKTTEVPDEIPALMTALGLLYWYVYMINSGDSFPFVVSAITGTLIAAAGYALYASGKWGGADAFMFAAIAYMVPVYGGRIFITDYIFNFIIVSAVYMFVYSFALGIMNPKIFSYFYEDLKGSWVYVVSLPAVYFAVLFIMQRASTALLFYGFVVFLFMLFWRYAVVIEKKLFRRRIRTTELKPGDVLEKMIWRGLTPGEVKKIRKEQSYVVIKEGIRFVPAFAINLVITLLYGNVLFLIFQ